MKGYIQDKTIIFDGAMGSMLSGKVPSGSIPEELNLSNPDIIKEIHSKYIDAGANFITTNTFGASRIVLKNEGKESLLESLNREAVKIAKSASNGNVKIAGSLGPTSFLPTLGHIDFDTMCTSYKEQASFLIDEGVNALLIETCQDILQVKSAIIGCKDAISELNSDVKIFITITLEKSGLMLLGTNISSVITTLAPFKPDALGINCSTGPDEMIPSIHYLTKHSPFPILIQPNAGLPQIVNNQTSYDLSPDEFANKVYKIVKEIGIEMVGGCCGTTPEHIRILSSLLTKVKRKKRKTDFKPAVSSLFSSFDLDQTPRPLIFAEQTNVNGSKTFKNLLNDEKYNDALDFAKSVSNGAHGLDINMSTTEGDEVSRFKKFIPLVAKTIDAVIMIDSTDSKVIETALKIIPGRPVINSINLEDETHAKEIIRLAKRYGSALIGLTIDENGMATVSSKKVKIARKLLEMVTAEGLTKDDLFIDCLTFPISSSGDKSAVETLNALPKINKFARTSLGVGNVSYGLSKDIRPYVTTIFFENALKKNLSLAIINNKKLINDADIEKTIRNNILKLLKGDKSKLNVLTKAPSLDISKQTFKSPEEILKHSIITGNRTNLESSIAKLIESYSPEKIMTTMLLPAMDEVGKLFANGKLPLPFVLESAESMKNAMDILSKFMEHEYETRGTIVLATVRGDVHDIGKNLVDIILSNSGFKVINLGVKQTMENIYKSAIENNADAIGLSALLTTSAMALADDITYLKNMSFNKPVLLGGAGLNKSFTENKIQKNYKNVLYCPNAISGLNAMQHISGATDANANI